MRPIWRVASLNGLKASTKVISHDPQEGWSQVLNRGPEQYTQVLEEKKTGWGRDTDFSLILNRSYEFEMDIWDEQDTSSCYDCCAESGFCERPQLRLAVVWCFLAPFNVKRKQMCRKTPRWLLSCVPPLMEPKCFSHLPVSLALRPSSTSISQSCSELVSHLPVHTLISVL